MISTAYERRKEIEELNEILVIRIVLRQKMLLGFRTGKESSSIFGQEKAVKISHFSVTERAVIGKTHPAIRFFV